MVVKASGDKDGNVKPPAYWREKEDKLVYRYVPANSEKLCAKDWEEVVQTMMMVWQIGTVAKPNVVMFHCNEGINRAVFVATLCTSKVHGSNPFKEAQILLSHRLQPF